jgi:hypothetical protein
MNKNIATSHIQIQLFSTKIREKKNKLSIQVSTKSEINNPHFVIYMHAEEIEINSREVFLINENHVILLVNVCVMYFKLWHMV